MIQLEIEETVKLVQIQNENGTHGVGITVELETRTKTNSTVHQFNIIQYFVLGLAC